MKYFPDVSLLVLKKPDIISANKYRQKLFYAVSADFSKPLKIILPLIKIVESYFLFNVINLTANHL